MVSGRIEFNPSPLILRERDVSGAGILAKGDTMIAIVFIVAFFNTAMLGARLYKDHPAKDDPHHTYYRIEIRPNGEPIQTCEELKKINQN